MIGYFTKVEMPTKVKVGEKIPLRISYYAKLVGAVSWSTCIMAKMDNLVMIVGVNREMGQEGRQTQDFKIFPMPSARQTIYFRLLGDRDPAHKWTPEGWGG